VKTLQFHSASLHIYIFDATIYIFLCLMYSFANCCIHYLKFCLLTFMLKIEVQHSKRYKNLHTIIIVLEYSEFDCVLLLIRVLYFQSVFLLLISYLFFELEELFLAFLVRQVCWGWTNSLSFCIKVYASFLKGSIARYNILGWQS
jgi:hypothetical protein